jgi:hypothetical protein
MAAPVCPRSSIVGIGGAAREQIATGAASLSGALRPDNPHQKLRRTRP